jgi:hypothetical protein
MSQPQSIMPGIHGSACRSIPGKDGDDVTFSGRKGVYFSIRDGELVIGPAILHDRDNLADMLIDYFGRSYRGALVMAERERDRALAHAKVVENRLKTVEEMLDKTEVRLSRHEKIQRTKRHPHNRKIDDTLDELSDDIEAAMTDEDDGPG